VAIAVTQMLVTAAGAQADTIDVCASCAHPTITSAVADANPAGGDTIAVAAGTYDEQVTVDRPVTIAGSGLPVVGDADGAFIVQSSGVTISGFATKGGTAATGFLVVGTVSGVSITGNVIAGNGGAGIDVPSTSSGGVHAHFNRFAANDPAIAAPNGTAVDATNNWFGCNGGPGATGCDAVSGDGVSASPYLKLAVGSSTEAIETGKQVTVTASLRTNSAGTDLGAIPFPAVPVAFSTSLGSITPSAALSQGAAAATLNVGSTPGTAHVTAALDAATATTDVRVLDMSTPPPSSDGGGGGTTTPPPPGNGTTIKLVLNTLTGTNLADRILGTDAAELLLGLAGDDELRGGKGDDRLFGGDGQDRVYGGDGDDRVNGGPGDDRVEGNNGNDLLEGSSGRDKLVGGRGNDVMVGGSGADSIIGHGGDDTVRGVTGDDVIDVRDHRNGDIVACGAGKDRVKADSRDVVAKDCEKVTRPKSKSKKSKSKKSRGRCW